MPAYYANSVEGFIADDSDSIFSALVTQDEGFSSLWRSAIDVWKDEVPWLQAKMCMAAALDPAVRNWGILLEFPIPRRQKRIDVVLLAKDIIIVLELKTTVDGSSAVAQAEDYALDLAAFHAGSSGVTIVPVVVAEKARAVIPEQVQESFTSGTLPRIDLYRRLLMPRARFSLAWRCARSPKPRAIHITSPQLWTVSSQS